jgi:nucleoside-diphosphate-sugar epimerase
MNILVTGATGLIGCHGAAQLARAGHRVRALGRIGDCAQQLLTRSVPVDDGAARALLDRALRPFADSLRDTLVWMHDAGVLEARHVGLTTAGRTSS